MPKERDAFNVKVQLSSKFLPAPMEGLSDVQQTSSLEERIRESRYGSWIIDGNVFGVCTGRGWSNWWRKSSFSCFSGCDSIILKLIETLRPYFRTGIRALTSNWNPNKFWLIMISRRRALTTGLTSWMTFDGFCTRCDLTGLASRSLCWRCPGLLSYQFRISLRAEGTLWQLWLTHFRLSRRGPPLFDLNYRNKTNTEV